MQIKSLKRCQTLIEKMENNTTLQSDGSSSTSEYSALWLVIYCIIICMALVGNLFTVLAITMSSKLSAMVSNQFIFSLALSDFLVGISIPYHMCFYMVDVVGTTKNTCLVRFVLIAFACASSIFNLFFIATDRFVAVVHPLRYNLYMTRKVSAGLISLGWLMSLTLSTVPIYWNWWKEKQICDITIIPAVYFEYVLTPMFVVVWTMMLMLYIKIWREATKHARRMRNTNNITSCHSINDTKSIQVVMLTLGCFSVCWMPYFIITTYYRISGTSNKFNLLYEIAFTMAVANSGMNPVIYAWKNSNFREAFWCLLTCHSPNEATKKNNGYITNHVPAKNKKSSNGTRKEASADIEMGTRKEHEESGGESNFSTEATNVNSTLSRT